MLKQRLITAIVLLTVFIATLLSPYPEFFGVLTLLFMAIGGWEWSRLNDVDGSIAYVLGCVLAVICASLWLLNGVPLIPKWLWLFVVALWVIGAPLILRSGGQSWLSIPKAIRLGLGIFLLTMAWAALWSCKLIGNNFLLSVLFLVWVADSGAYFGGKKFGKRKLAPKVSPGKSWEGAISGALAVLILAGGWIFLDSLAWGGDTLNSQSIYTYIFQKYSVIGLLIGVLFLTGMSVVGDLTESLMKRSIGMKDSSQILPGHGGVLDRVDALLPVLPLSMTIFLFIN